MKTSASSTPTVIADDAQMILYTPADGKDRVSLYAKDGQVWAFSKSNGRTFCHLPPQYFNAHI